MGLTGVMVGGLYGRSKKVRASVVYPQQTPAYKQQDPNFDQQQAPGNGDNISLIIRLLCEFKSQSNAKSRGN